MTSRAVLHPPQFNHKTCYLSGVFVVQGTVSQPDVHTGVLTPLLRHPPTTKVETRLLATSPANHKFRIAANIANAVLALLK